MLEEELIALVPTIVDELTLARLSDDIEQFNVILGGLLNDDKMEAYEALGELEDLLADISAVPKNSGLTAEEWDTRRSDFCRAAEFYLDGRWKQSRAVKGH